MYPKLKSLCKIVGPKAYKKAKIAAWLMEAGEVSAKVAGIQFGVSENLVQKIYDIYSSNDYAEWAIQTHD